MSTLAKRVAVRYAAKLHGVYRVLLEDLDPDLIETYIQGLVDSIEDIDAAEAELGLDLRNMVQLLDEFPHNDDIHHNGETTLTHTRWVLEDLQEIAKDKDETQRHMLNLVALLHDLGKAYTHEVIDGKHTFRQHAKVSVGIAKKMLAQLQKDDAQLYKRILTLVEHHDLFMNLVEARKSSSGNKRYINKLLRSAIYLGGQLDDLITFSKADGARAQRMQETLDGMLEVLDDLHPVESDRAEEARQQQLRDRPPAETVEAVRSILQEEAPELVSLLPNIRRVNQELGKARRYDVLKRIEEVR
jgi:putative nucleotidyltransferase with HDIG domain